MKTLIYIIASALFLISLSSCMEAHRRYCRDSKNLPLDKNFNEPNKLITGFLYTSDLRKLFNVPTDATNINFSIGGLSIKVNPTSGAGADFVEYTLKFRGSPGYEPDWQILVNNKHHFVTTGDAFSISSELDQTTLVELKCMLQFLIEKDIASLCHTGYVEYEMDLKAVDNAGNPKDFQGSMTGYLNFTISYTVCEDVPTLMFNFSELCEK